MILSIYNVNMMLLTELQIKRLPSPLVKYEKQLPKEENKKSGNAMQKLMDSYVCGINKRSESSLVLSNLLLV